MKCNKQTWRSNKRSRQWRNDLAQERRARELSLKQASLILGIPLKTLANYERGNYLPSLVAAFKLQILYRGQIASFYDSFYSGLTQVIRASEERVLKKRGTT